MTETITVCPECDSAAIKANSTRDPTKPRYRCDECCTRFDAPATRERHHPGSKTSGSEYIRAALEYDGTDA